MQVKLADGWTNVFPNLPYKAANGHVIKWSVHAAKVPYYSAGAAGASGSLAKLTYVFGSGGNGGGDTAKPARHLGDPTVYLASTLTEKQKNDYKLANQRALAFFQELSEIARSGGNENAVNFTALHKVSQGIRGWLVLDGTAIDYPIMKGTNNTYYLNHLPNKEVNYCGSLFIDSGCNRNFNGRNTVIYGHNLSGGSMLASLAEYKNQSYFDAHPTMQLYTPDGNYTIELFASFVSSDAYTRAAKTSFSGDTAFLDHINACIRKSDITADVKINAGDKIVTFVTASNEYDDARYVVMGRLAALAS